MEKKKGNTSSKRKKPDSSKTLDERVKSIKVKKIDKDGNSSYLNEDCVEIIRYNPISAEISLFNGKITEKLKEITLDQEGNIYVVCQNGNNYLIYQQDDNTFNIRLQK